VAQYIVASYVSGWQTGRGAVIAEPVIWLGAIQ